MRHSIYRLVTRNNHHNPASRAYNVFIMAVAVLSILPLTIRENAYWLQRLDLWTVYILFIDFVLRWMTADYEHQRQKRWAFVLYPLMPLSIMSFLSLMPSLHLLPESLRILRLFRLSVVLHYSRNFTYISNVLKRERATLLTVLWIALGYILISALVMFVCEPETFPNYFDAIYWATTALTTVGYGDIYPHNDLGRIVSMISSLFGIAVISLPAGIITAGFMNELQSARENTREKRASSQLKIAEEEILELQKLLSSYLEAKQEGGDQNDLST